MGERGGEDGLGDGGEGGGFGWGGEVGGIFVFLVNWAEAVVGIQWEIYLC